MADILVTTTENIPGKDYEIIGEAFGVTTQSRNAISDFGAGLKSIVGGEIKGYTKMLTNSRLEAISRLKEEAANFDHIRALFDFYSQAETGMDESWFKKKNQWLRKCNLETAAFISGDGVKRGPFFAGETTLESQRGVYPLAAALNLKDLACSNVIVGDRLTSETIKSFARYTKEHAITLHVVDEESSLLEENHWYNYLYLAQDIVRLHCEGKLPELEAQELPLDRPAGTISINSNGLNSDEVHITKRNLPADKEVRIVGKVCASECSLLSHIEPGQKVVFKKLEK